MLLSSGLLRRRLRPLLLYALVCVVTLWLLSGVQRRIESQALHATLIEERYPLAWKHIHSFNGTGGAWYIPPGWLPYGQEPQSILEAAQLASKAANSMLERQMPFSNIPLIIHQKAALSCIDTWKAQLLPWVEKWLDFATSGRDYPQVAYFFWNDQGITTFFREHEPDFSNNFEKLLTTVEWLDTFRILVCKKYGGIYADIDTKPIRHPTDWIHSSDLAEWTDDVSGKTYGLKTIVNSSAKHDAAALGSQPVSLIWGIESDKDPNTDTHWRNDYTYAIQLTQWALASAPDHPVLELFMRNLRADLHRAVMFGKDYDPGKSDPLSLTGPAAVTLSTSMWLAQEFGFRWNSLTGLKDGGKAKLVSDILILPITGFSKKTRRFYSPGGRSPTHPDARLAHFSMGSWRRYDVVVEYGRFCRKVFGLCREWPKAWSRTS